MKILFTGDFYPASMKINNLDKKYVYGNCYHLFEESDLIVINFECSLDNEIPRIKQGPNLYLDKKYLDLLWKDKTICCLANNHSTDFGERGLVRTENILNQNKLQTIGTLRNPFYEENNIVIINLCEDEGGEGIAFYSRYLLEQIKNKDKIKILVYHGGNEGYPLPNQTIQKDFEYYLSTNKLDCIISHHNHVPSGYSHINDKFVSYGLGNFLFKNHFSNFGYFVIYDTDAKNYFVHGYRILEDRIEAYDLEDHLRYLNKLDLNYEWQNCWKIFSKLKYYRYKNWLKEFLNKNSDKDILNFFQCESHRNCIIDGIKNADYDNPKLEEIIKKISKF